MLFVSYKLTKRQQEVLFLYIQGETEGTISNILGIKKTSVKTHRIRACKKLGVRTITEALNKLQKSNYFPNIGLTSKFLYKKYVFLGSIDDSVSRRK